MDIITFHDACAITDYDALIKRLRNMIQHAGNSNDTNAAHDSFAIELYNQSLTTPGAIKSKNSIFSPDLLQTGLQIAASYPSENMAQVPFEIDSVNILRRQSAKS
jgi:hypothetical protein